MTKPVDAPREVAARIIMLAERRNTPLQETLSFHLNSAALPDSARSQVADLVYGYFRTRIRLVYILGKLAKKPAALPGPLFIMLALGVYSLLFQDKAKDFVIINNTVEWTTRFLGRSMARVANAILRACQRSRDELLDIEWYGGGKTADLRTQALFYAMPLPIAELWATSYGEDAAQMLLRRSFQRPWTGLRVNSSHPASRSLRGFFSALPAQEMKIIDDYGFALAPGALPDDILRRSLADWMNCGAIVRQAGGSLQIMKELGLFDWDAPVWDCCAGIGSKSAALLDRGVNVRLCSDTSRKRLLTFSHLQRTGKNLQPVLADAKKPPFKNFSGHILADVPCSGLGVLARRPDIRKIENNFARRLDEFRLEQAGILESIYHLLQVNCQIAYITCTLNPNENERLVEEFLRDKRDLEITRKWSTPHDNPWLEGMFGVVLKKTRRLPVRVAG